MTHIAKLTMGRVRDRAYMGRETQEPVKGLRMKDERSLKTIEDDMVKTILDAIGLSSSQAQSVAQAIMREFVVLPKEEK